MTGDRSRTSPQPFVQLDPQQAGTVVRTLFDKEPTSPPTRLATERDDTFRVRADDGEYILKVAPPGDDPMVIDLQTKALEHASRTDPTLPLQQVVQAVDGTQQPHVRLQPGPERVARLLTFLTGTRLRDARPTPRQLEACGRVQAKLALALKSFDHPAADRHLMFDLQHFDELRPVLPAGERNERIASVFSWFDKVLIPRATELPAQVLHADFGLDNVLVDDTSPDFVTGVLDWGDVVRTWRAADLASGLASQVAADGPPWEGPARMIDGYRSVIELTPVELEVLPGLVAMRIAQRILMAELLSASMSDNADYLRRNVDLSYRQLANLDL